MTPGAFRLPGVIPLEYRLLEHRLTRYTAGSLHT
jgi:hypothetical protein